jgi:hypothetical protein
MKTEQEKDKQRKRVTARSRLGATRNDDAKRARGACRCGFPATPENLCALDWAHRDAKDKLYNPGTMRTMSDEAYFAEIAKCDLVCANCHRKESDAQHKAGLIRRGRPRKAS